MDIDGLKEMFNYVRGKGVARKNSTSNLGNISSYYMDGDIPTLVLDNEQEIDVNNITSGNFVILEQGGANNRQAVRQTINEDHHHDDDGDDGEKINDPSSIKKEIKVAPLMDLGESTEDGIPVLRPDPEFIEHATNKQLNNTGKQNIQENIRTAAPQEKTIINHIAINQSPAIVLLEKAKTKKIKINLELEIDAYDESLISVLITNYGDEVKTDVINFIISKMDNESLKNSISDQLKLAYKSLDE